MTIVGLSPWTWAGAIALSVAVTTLKVPPQYAAAIYITGGAVLGILDRMTKKEGGE